MISFEELCDVFEKENLSYGTQSKYNENGGQKNIMYI